MATDIDDDYADSLGDNTTAESGDSVSTPLSKHPSQELEIRHPQEHGTFPPSLSWGRKVSK